MKTAKKVLLCVSLITLSLALVLAPFTGAIDENVTAGNTTDGVWNIISEVILSDDSLLASLGDSPTTWTVHPTDESANFRTIQSAIDNSNVAYGDSIEVWNGTYNEAVVLDKRLTLYSMDGANDTIIDAGGSGNAITIKADSCTVDGFMATGSGHYPGDAGIKVGSNRNNIVNNICCANKYNGIRLSDSSNNTILNNTCYENNNAGIYLWNSAYNTISNNEIGDKNCDGIFLSYSSDNMIRDNKIARNKRSGIFMLNSTTNTISNNSCYENKEKGIYLAGCTNNIIKNNGIWHNDGAGIYMMGCTNIIISYNEISDNFLDGLYVSQSSDNVVSNNEICRNQAGVRVTFSSNNRIYCNDFVYNRKNVISDDSDSIWNLTSVYTYNGRRYTNYIGNYFSDYDGADYNSDGIGDELYDIWLSAGNVGAPEGVPYNTTFDVGGAMSGTYNYTFDVEGAMRGNNIYPLIRPFKFYILAPIADFTFSPLDPRVNERVIFDASLSYDPDGAINFYQWDFGDGNITTSMAESTITHYYRSTADYTVTLTVIDNSGAISSTSKVITIILKIPILLPQPLPILLPQPLPILPAPPPPAP